MSNEDKKRQLEEQINLRIDLLEKAIDGKLDGIDVPSKLTSMREWEDIGLGVKRIGSPGSFVTTHKVYGRKINKIKKLQSELFKPSRPKAKSVTQRYQDAAKENTRLKKLLQVTTNQFVQYRGDIKKLKEDMVLSKSIESGLREQIKELETEIDEANADLNKLRKRLMKLETSSKSKVTKVDFRK